MIIAVDVPAASGKGTIARALAHRYKLPHLDTGLLYRAVAATVLQHDLDPGIEADAVASRSEEHTSELQSLMRISYAVFCLTKKKKTKLQPYHRRTESNHL